MRTTPSKSSNIIVESNSALENPEKKFEQILLWKYIRKNQWDSTENFPLKIVVHRVSKILDANTKTIIWQLYFLWETGNENVATLHELDELYYKLPSLWDIKSLVIESFKKLFSWK